MKPLLSVTNKRTDKLLGDYHFRNPKGHTNDEKALIFFELVEEVKTICLFEKY